MLGTTELIIISGIVILLFGADKLPRLGSSIGESIRNFKKGVKSETKANLSKSSDSTETSKGL